jgi:hypothetical protein
VTVFSKIDTVYIKTGTVLIKIDTVHPKFDEKIRTSRVFFSTRRIFKHWVHIHAFFFQDTVRVFK